MSPERQILASTLLAAYAFRAIPGTAAINRHGHKTRIGEDGHIGAGFLPDLDDPLTRAGLAVLAREALNEPTAHARPVHQDRLSDCEPEIRWHVERPVEGEHEWLRYSGAWGAGDHRDPPINEATEIEAYAAAILAAPAKP